MKKVYIVTKNLKRPGHTPSEILIDSVFKKKKKARKFMLGLRALPETNAAWVETFKVKK